MTWLRLDDDFASDGTIRRCRAVQWWPLILCAMKRGGGVASDDDIAADVLADIGQGSEEAAGLAVERLKAAGKLVEVDGGWSTPAWSEFQPDPTASDRARRYRERNKAVASAAASRCVTVTSRDETVRHGDVTGENGSSRLTVQDMTEQNRTEQATVVATTSRPRVESAAPSLLPTAAADEATHTHEAMPLPLTAAEIPELAELVNAWWSTQLGQGGRRPGFITPPAVSGAIKALLDKHGAERLRWAIGAAVEKTNQGAPSIAFLTRLCEGGPLPERRPFGMGAALAVGRQPADPGAEMRRLAEESQKAKDAAERERAELESLPECPRCHGRGCLGWGDKWKCHSGRMTPAEPYEIDMARDIAPDARWEA